MLSYSSFKASHPFTPSHGQTGDSSWAVLVVALTWDLGGLFPPDDPSVRLTGRAGKLCEAENQFLPPSELGAKGKSATLSGDGLAVVNSSRRCIQGSNMDHINWCCWFLLIRQQLKTSAGSLVLLLQNQLISDSGRCVCVCMCVWCVCVCLCENTSTQLRLITGCARWSCLYLPELWGPRSLGYLVF